MKQGIHPNYGPASIRCACGNVIETQSTVTGVIQVDVCSACHPFFTGKQKLLDTAGRIDRFKKKFEGKVTIGASKKRPTLAKVEINKTSVPPRKVVANKPLKEQLKDAKGKSGAPVEGKGKPAADQPKKK